MNMYKIMCKQLIAEGRLLEIVFNNKEKLISYIENHKHKYWIYDHDEINDQYILLILK